MNKNLLVILSCLFFLFTGGSVVHGFNFEMEIRVSVPDSAADNGKATNRLIAGGKENAKYGFDPQLDVPALFIQNSPIKAFFPRGDLSPELDPLWRDFRENQLPVAWTIEVSSVKDQSPITLQWAASVNASGCESVKFNLTDRTTGQVIDMQVASNYTFTNDSLKKREFLLMAQAAQNTPPQTPGRLWNPRQGKSGVLLTWSLPFGGDDVGYRIERRQGTGSFQPLVTVPLSTNKFLDRNIVRGNTYTYQVIAESNSGCQSGSSEALTLTIP
jgi:hypothetical protein